MSRLPRISRTLLFLDVASAVFAALDPHPIQFWAALRDVWADWKAIAS